MRAMREIMARREADDPADAALGLRDKESRFIDDGVAGAGEQGREVVVEHKGVDVVGVDVSVRRACCRRRDSSWGRARARSAAPASRSRPAMGAARGAATPEPTPP